MPGECMSELPANATPREVVAGPTGKQAGVARRTDGPAIGQGRGPGGSIWGWSRQKSGFSRGGRPDAYRGRRDHARVAR